MVKVLKRVAFCIVAFLVIFNLSVVSSTAAANNDSNDRSVEAFKTKLDKAVPELQKHYGVPGVAVGIIHEGNIKYVLNYGVADKKSNKPVNDKTAFQLASISKSLTAWGIMKLMEEGKISLDDPAEKYLTRWHLPESQFNKNEVTIKRLLSHTAGLTVHGYLGTEPGKRLPSIEESLTGKGFFKEPLQIAMQPGKDVSYSGGGYTLLQLIIEEVTGMAFDQYMEKEILKPLGMESSTFSDNYSDENMSGCYGYFNQQIPNYNFTEKAAAGLKTTVPDFLKFMMANMDLNNKSGESNILKSETLNLIHKPVLSDSGLGIYAKVLSDGSELLYHGGDNRGWHAVYGIIPQKKDGIVIFTNSDNGIDLRQDVYNFWVEHETGALPEQYNLMEKSRNTNYIIAISLGIILAIYILVFAIRLKLGKSVFIVKKEGSSLFGFCLRVFIPLSLGITLYYIIYKIDILQLQGGVKNIALVIFIWMLSLIITGFFPKSRKS